MSPVPKAPAAHAANHDTTPKKVPAALLLTVEEADEAKHEKHAKKAPAAPLLKADAAKYEKHAKKAPAAPLLKNSTPTAIPANLPHPTPTIPSAICPLFDRDISTRTYWALKPVSHYADPAGDFPLVAHLSGIMRRENETLIKDKSFWSCALSHFLSFFLCPSPLRHHLLILCVCVCAQAFQQ